MEAAKFILCCWFLSESHNASEASSEKRQNTCTCPRVGSSKLQGLRQPEGIQRSSRKPAHCTMGGIKGKNPKRQRLAYCGYKPAKDRWQLQQNFGSSLFLEIWNVSESHPEFLFLKERTLKQLKQCCYMKRMEEAAQVTNLTCLKLQVIALWPPALERHTKTATLNPLCLSLSHVLNINAFPKILPVTVR